MNGYNRDIFSLGTIEEDKEKVLITQSISQPLLPPAVKDRNPKLETTMTISFMIIMDFLGFLEEEKVVTRVTTEYKSLPKNPKLLKGLFWPKGKQPWQTAEANSGLYLASKLTY